MESILIVDDDLGFRGFLETVLAGESYPVAAAATLQQARDIAGRRQFGLVLTDLRLPDGDGLELLRWFKETSPETAVIVITAFGTLPGAVEAMKAGAADYLGKPLRSPDE